MRTKRQAELKQKFADQKQTYKQKILGVCIHPI